MKAGNTGKVSERLCVVRVEQTQNQYCSRSRARTNMRARIHLLFPVLCIEPRSVILKVPLHFSRYTILFCR